MEILFLLRGSGKLHLRLCPCIQPCKINYSCNNLSNCSKHLCDNTLNSQKAVDWNCKWNISSVIPFLHFSSSDVYVAEDFPLSLFSSYSALSPSPILRHLAAIILVPSSLSKINSTRLSLNQTNSFRNNTWLSLAAKKQR